ncbi:MAG TPA: PASTA domain-containing protein, partial [Ferruginibacter sp.]|nr:PASTA domain-containing protein [Ferruginibacter sp.]
DTIYKTDWQMGAVLEQQYRGTRIPEKAKVQWGSRITLIVGGGLGNQQIPVPFLIGLRFEEAKAVLDANGINIGALFSEVRITDTATAFVIGQSPEKFDAERRQQYIQSGQVMDLKVSPVMIAPTVDSVATKK